MSERARLEDTIGADEIVVDYDHPHGRLLGVALLDILKTPKDAGRKILSISNPRTKQVIP